jgi:hypothetical protein
MPRKVLGWGTAAFCVETTLGLRALDINRP